MKNNNMLSLPELQHVAYEAFKLHWMTAHGYTAADLLEKYSDYWGEVETDTEGMYDFWNWLNDTGFNGEIWPSLQEFLDHEFKDVNLMYQLLNAEQYSAYLSLLSKICYDSDYAVRHLSLVKSGDVLLYDGCKYVATTDAYKTNTEIGSEWNVEVTSNEGTEEYLYASYFAHGEVQIILPSEEEVTA